MDALVGNDDESLELKKLVSELHQNPDNFETWEKLVKCGESLEGGINRNSSSQAITAVRDIYDQFLAKFPLFIGYWKKYADLEFSIAGTEAAELVYERGVASIVNSVDLWMNYCSFKTETSHDPEIIRDANNYDWTIMRCIYGKLNDGLFERGSSCVGLDFLAHPFWDKYLEFEERNEAYDRIDRIFALLGRIILIPMHQYARYFEKYRQLAQSQPLVSTVPGDVLNQFQVELDSEGGGYKAERSQLEVERDLRTRVDEYHLNVFQKTQTETTKRWPFESAIKRPYFHVTELDYEQLSNWKKYLDFEEAEGDYVRTQFLYERCLVSCAQLDHFWHRYARWMFAQPGKEEEVRNIYQRASCLFIPIALPSIRHHWAYFEEMCGRVDVAEDIHRGILLELPSHVETIISLANTSRRHEGLDAAIAVYNEQLASQNCDDQAKAALVAEWAKLLWKVKGSPEEARQIFQKNQHWYLESEPFWTSYLQFEIEQPTNAATEKAHYAQIKAVVNDIVQKTRLSSSTVQVLVTKYMQYLLERGTEDATKEFLNLDKQINGPSSIRKSLKSIASGDDTKASVLNGQPAV